MPSKISAILKSKRKSLKLSVKEVVTLLAENGISIADKTLYGWENGVRQPDADTFITLCKIYGINSFTTLENYQTKKIPDELSEIYNNLNSEGQRKLLDYAKDLAQIIQYKKCDTIPEQEIG